MANEPSALKSLIRFVPRQAARGFCTVNGLSGNASIFLFNNSSNYYLVLLGLMYSVQNNNDQVNMGTVLGNPPGNVSGTVEPMVTGASRPPGQFFSLDWTTTLTPSIETLGQIAYTVWFPYWPIAIIQPTSSFCVQNVTSHHTMNLNVFYEFLTALQLDVDEVVAAPAPEEFEIVGTMRRRG